MEIKGKTAIITGATGKLGGAIVMTLAKAGAQCVCIYHRNSTQAKKLRTALNKLKTKNLFIRADLTVPENIENVFANIKKLDSTGSPQVSTPQILINAAAIFEKKPVEDITFEYIRQMFDINFAAAIMMTCKFVELVRREIKNKQNLSSTAIGEPIAKIINIADIVAQKPPAGFSIYCASKAALIAATKSLAKELAPSFTVNTVSPGIINWPFGLVQLRSPQVAQSRQKNITARQKKKILAHIPAGRTGRPKEIVEAVKFLIENDYVTGQIINVDGGKSL
jgi:pteridine reductase